MKYKVGDKVRVKSPEWYINNYDILLGKIIIDTHIFTTSMAKHCGNIVTIDFVCDDSYHIKEDDGLNGWTDEMFEGLAEDTIQPAVSENIVFPNENYADKVELCLGDDYEVVVENGKTFVQKKKLKYPTTYKECCGVLGMTFDYPNITKVSIEEYNLYSSLIRLIRCRDAYWKVAGKQMGLNKSWKFENPSKRYVFTIEYSGGEIIQNAATSKMWNRILVFPIEEMRDAFYENFKDLIEKCKELI